MATQVTIRSREQILGDIIRSLSINSDITAFNAGSDIGTLLEGISESISQVETTALKILETINIDALVGTALDKKAQSSRIPNGQGGFGRKPAVQSSGPVVIGSSFTKISSKLYAGKPAPFAGSTVLNVEDASSFPLTGSVYIGRGTIDRFEGKIPYTTAPANNGSFWTIALDQPMTKDHLQSDVITLAQGGDRTVAANAEVQILANSDSPAVSFTTTQDLLIPDGEDEGTVNVICKQFGEVGNALAGSIVSFPNEPFAGATVRNTTTFRNGQSTESDEDLRQRIKNYPATLSRGTDQAILAAINGATDPDTGRSIQSAKILPPVEPGDIARVFIDDGTGLEPSFDNQPSELILKSASGQETRFRTSQFPITASTMEGAEKAPYVLTSGMTLTVKVDDIVETYTITASNYNNLSSATAFEIIRDLNSQSNLVGFRTIDEGKRIVGIDLSGESETAIVSESDLQKVIGFPTAELRPIFLYKNSELLSFKGKTATLTTRARNSWDSLTEADLANVRVRVDGVIQTFSILNSDFNGFGSNITTATISEWATIFSRKIAGVKFTASGQVLVWSTFNSFSPNGQLEILTTRADGTSPGWIGDNKIWLSAASGGKLSDVGDTKDYDFNRFSGEVTLLAKPADGDTIEIATRDTRALIRSLETESGLYTLSPIVTTVDNARLIMGFDGQFAVRDVIVSSGAELVPTKPDPVNAANIIRITTNDTGIFNNSVVGDSFYVVRVNSALTNVFPIAAEAFYRIIARGFNETSSDVVFSGLIGSTNFLTGLTATVIPDSATVTVSLTGHGLRTGDLVSVSTVATIGGITGVNLSVTDAPVTKISDNKYTYQALANGTSVGVGTLNGVGNNKITVAHTSHGINDGAEISTSVLTGFGGLTPAELSILNTSIELIDTDSYFYRTTKAATSSAVTQVINSVTKIKDTWVEFEVSTPLLVTWNAMLSTAFGITDNMIHLFKSSGATPQLVDFGAAASSLSVDDVVSAINSQIASGEAIKENPRQAEIRSGKFDKTGTCAILAAIGNSVNLFDTAVSSAIQAHIAFSPSGVVRGGGPVVGSIENPTAPALGYPTRTYLKIDKNITNVLDEASNPAIESPTIYNLSYPTGFQQLWITGRAEGYSSRVYNNQTTAPFTGIMTGSDIIRPLNTFDDIQTNVASLDRYSNIGLRLQDLPVNNYDSLVVEMDLNPTDKTVSVPMTKLAKILDIDAIAGSGKGQVISFRLLDPEDSDKPFFDTTSIYKDFDFTDFKLLTKSVGVYREDVSDRALIVRSVDYGAASQLRFSIRFPTDPDQSDFLITHSTDFLNDKSRVNLIATLPSAATLPGSLLGSGQYKVTASLSGTIYDWRISSPSLNSGSSYVAGNVLNISGTSSLSGSYYISSSVTAAFTNVSATTVNGSNVVTVTQPAHGLQTGDLVDVTSSSAIGGITALQLSVSDAEITVLNVNTFSFIAAANATSNGAGVIAAVNGGVVVVKAPGSGGLSPSSFFDAAIAPIRTYELVDKTFEDLATAITEFLPDNPIATGEAIGTDLSINPILFPTYFASPNALAYSGPDVTGAFSHHSFETKYSGSAGIFQYDSSNTTLNNIKATVQTDESIFPTTTEVSGTSYLPVGEEVQLVPTNTKSLSKWMNFRAVTSLSILSSVERTDSDSKIQISSLEDGSDGTVKVTGVNSNEVEMTIIGNASNLDDSTRVTALSADVRSLLPGQFIKVENALSAELSRTYRDIPTGSSITLANTETVNTYFRKTNSIKYLKTGANSGRLVFLRNGTHSTQTEPLTALHEITLTNLTNGLVRVTSAQGAAASAPSLSARVGDMMYIQPNSPFSIDAESKAISSGITTPTLPEYLGYPVVHVIDDDNIVIIAPNITTFGTTVLAAAEDLVFTPAVWNEKNIRTSHQEGAKFDDLVSNDAHFLIKPLGGGLVSMFMQNSSTEATDDMLLDTMSVGTDDYAIFGSGFDPANQGTFKVVAHNGRNHVVVFNPGFGVDEIIDINSLENGGEGSRKWRVGPLDITERSFRIIAGESVRIGDRLRISSPSSGAQWFNDTFFGSWEITGIGMQALDYTAFLLPHDNTDGSYDQAFAAPYVDFIIPNAPISVTNSLGADVDNFLISDNDTSIGFTEGTPFVGYRTVIGHGVNNQSVENRDLYMRPQISTSKMSNTFGTKIFALNKIGFEERAFQGIDGYKIFSGLVRQAHRIIDGLPNNTTVFPGVKAAGAIVEVQTPLIRSIQVSLQVRPTDGVTLNSISELVKSSVAGYVNQLDVGTPVVISEILRTVQSLPGVFSVKILTTTPVATDDRIVVGDFERAFILDITTDVSVG